MAENIFGITDTGRQRDNNEDAFLAQKVEGDRYLLACVIDGVGGYEGGEVAAAIARQTILESLQQKKGSLTDKIKQSFTVANEKIFAEKEKGGATESMACVVTLALADLVNNELHYAHVGDTRLYLWRDASLVKLSKDHSFVGFLEDSGRLTEAAAMGHPKRNEINKALGFTRQMALDADYIETGSSPFLPGDLILLCSDGLTDMVNREEITEILVRKDSLKAKAEALVQQANANGGKDNITVVLAVNNKKPLKQVALKPVATEKTTVQDATIVKESESPVYGPVGQARGKGLLLFLGLLSLLLLLVIAWLWWKNKKDDASPQMKNEPVPARQTADGVWLQDTIQKGSDTLVLREGFTGKDIHLSDRILIGRDSIFMKGPGIRLIADSTYKGPGLVVSAGKHMVLDSITLEGFDIGLLISKAHVEIRQVVFVNCRVPVQYQPQQAAVVLNGSLKEAEGAQKDSSLH